MCLNRVSSLSIQCLPTFTFYKLLPLIPSSYYLLFVLFICGARGKSSNNASSSGGAEFSARLLLTKNPARSFCCPICQTRGISFERFPRDRVTNYDSSNVTVTCVVLINWQPLYAYVGKAKGVCMQGSQQVVVFDFCAPLWERGLNLNLYVAN